VNFQVTLPPHAPHDTAGEATLVMPLGIHADTGRFFPLIPLPAAPSGGPTAVLRIESLPIPIRCAHHGRWHALPGAVVPAEALSDLYISASNPAAALGTALALASARSCKSAAQQASAFQAAWKALHKKLVPRRHAVDGTTLSVPAAEMGAILDTSIALLTLLPRAMARSGIDLREALDALASARLPRPSDTGWYAPDGPVLPHMCAAGEDWHAAGGVTIRSLHSSSSFILIAQGMCAALAAQASTTCEEAAARLRLAAPHLNNSSQHRTHTYRRAPAMACRNAARALRAVLLPSADLALEAIKNA
jgi:hypothetical protein